MTVEYLKLIKIDHENNIVQEEPLNSEGNVRDYVMDIIGLITDNAGERRYRFKDDELTMKTWIGDIVNNNNRDDHAMDIANRLLQKEDDAQQRYHTITEIQKGILLIAYCKMTDTEYKMVICKADYTEFIEETTGEKKNGLPMKKKIFKSFAANITVNAGAYSFISLLLNLCRLVFKSGDIHDFTSRLFSLSSRKLLEISSPVQIK